MIPNQSGSPGVILGSGVLYISQVDANMWPQVQTTALQASISLALSVLLPHCIPTPGPCFLNIKRSFLPQTIVLAILYLHLTLLCFSHYWFFLTTQVIPQRPFLTIVFKIFSPITLFIFFITLSL